MITERQRLMELAPLVPPELAEAWQTAAEASLAPPSEEGWKHEALVEQ